MKGIVRQAAISTILVINVGLVLGQTITPSKRSPDAIKRYEGSQERVRQAEDEFDRFVALMDTGKASVEIGENEEAVDLAEESMLLVEK